MVNQTKLFHKWGIPLNTEPEMLASTAILERGDQDGAKKRDLHIHSQFNVRPLLRIERSRTS